MNTQTNNAQKLTLASTRFPNRKCRAATLFRISGGTSCLTVSLRIRVAVPYAESAPWTSDCSRIWASSIQASKSSGNCSVTFLRWVFKKKKNSVQFVISDMFAAIKIRGKMPTAKSANLKTCEIFYRNIVYLKLYKDICLTIFQK